MDIDDLQGLRRRDWLRSETVSDSSTRVFWAQSSVYFVDIRIPLDRPSIEDVSSIDELDANTLLKLMDAEGFAGNITLTDAICTWNREINWHGETDSIDAGKLWFSEKKEVLIEDGIHANYKEQWKIVPKQNFQVKPILIENMNGLLLWSNTLFIFGIGKLNAKNTDSLREQLSNQIIPTDVKTFFESEYCIGHWKGDTGIAELSTNPFRENQIVLRKQDGSIYWVMQTPDGPEIHYKI